MTRLNNAVLADLPASVRRPRYRRDATRIGVAHFGPGAFHRAHQAWFLDEMLARDPGLAICGISLRTAELRDALLPQDGLYTLVERGAEPRLRVIGSMREVLVAAGTPDRVTARLADPAVRLVTATVTEKGYALRPDGDLDTGRPEIRSDLETAEAPTSFVGWLAHGLRWRHAAGAGGLVVLSCDNLPANGPSLRRAVLQFAEARGEPDLARWIDGEVRFPATMVDSITPATDETLRAEVAAALGVTDAWPVQREAYLQWVVEDQLGDLADVFAGAGVTLAADIAPYEQAKLRVLNAAHSALAYLGLRLGLRTVAEAMADPALAGFLARLIDQDILPALPPGPVDLQDYAAATLRRFRNPTIAHGLEQIAQDGSQKLPVRLLPTIAGAVAQARPLERLAVPLAAWMLFVRDRARRGAPILDPLVGRLAETGRTCDGDPAADAARWLALSEVFPPRLAGEPRLRAALARAYGALDRAPGEALAL